MTAGSLHSQPTAMKPLHVAMLVLVTVVWGFNFSASKFALQSFQPFETNSLRFLMVFILLLPFFKRVPGQELRLIGLGLLMGGLHFGFMFIGVAKGADLSVLAITTQLNVPFSAILAVVILREAVGWRRWSAIALSFTGVVVMSFDPKVFTYLDAIMWSALAALCFGTGAVMMRSMKDIPAMTTQAWIAGTGAISTAILALIFEPGSFSGFGEATSVSWLGVAFGAVFSSVLGHGFANYLLRLYEVAMVTPYFLMMPIFAILGGYLMFGEVLTLQIVAGGLLTMVGVTIVTLRNMTKTKTIDPAASMAEET